MQRFYEEERDVEGGLGGFPPRGNTGAHLQVVRSFVHHRPLTGLIYRSLFFEEQPQKKVRRRDPS